MTNTLSRFLLFLAMIATTAVLCSSNSLLAETDKESRSLSKSADKKTFDETIDTFLNEYCTDCHIETEHTADVVLSGISFDLASGHDMELWKTVLKQLHLEEMPPATEKQPKQYEKDAVMFWINSEGGTTCQLDNGDDSD